MNFPAPQDTLATARRLKAAGNLPAAIDLVRPLLGQAPEIAEAWALCGGWLHQTGDSNGAVELLRRGLQRHPAHPGLWCNLAVTLRGLGQLADALDAYERARVLAPNDTTILYNLANALHEADRRQDAAAVYEAVVRLTPANATARQRLAATLWELGCCDAAIQEQRQVVAVRPESADFHSQLGTMLRLHGQFAEAERELLLALRCEPGHVAATQQLAWLRIQAGEWSAAVDCLQQCLAVQPQAAAIHVLLAKTLLRMGKWQDAAATADRMVALSPDDPTGIYLRAQALQGLGRHAEGIVQLQSAAERFPTAEAYVRWARALADAQRPDEAAAAFRAAAQIDPRNTEAHIGVAKALAEQGEQEAAYILLHEAREHCDDPAAAGSASLVLLNYVPSATDADRWQAAVDWAQRFAPPPFAEQWADRSPSKTRLRVGYFITAHLSHFLWGLLPHHDRTQFEVVVYVSGAAKPGRFGDSLRPHAEHFRDITDLSDDEAALQMRADGLDVVVDCALHTAGGRPNIFARRSAPVQVNWLGYPGTSGLSTMDYRFTDRWLDPAGAEVPSSERPWPLAGSYWCYNPRGAALPIGPPPAEQAGAVTFGSLNNLCKITDESLNHWSAVLQAAPQSRFLCLAPESQRRAALWAAFADRGVAGERIGFVPPGTRVDYLAHYQKLDIALDPVPCPGHVTSLDAFWMGVPVVAGRGRTLIGRAGESIAGNLGLSELVAVNRDDYVRIAVDLARDLPRLAELRRSLRERMQRSPLMDAARFVRNLEQAYAEMHRRRIEGQAEK